jgi:hypothetical protein
MISQPDDFESEKPICGILSLAAPFVGFLVGMVWAGSLRGDSTGVGGAMCMLTSMPVAFLAGTILAIVALRRRESRALAVTGLVLNAGPLLLVLFLVGVTILLN